MLAGSASLAFASEDGELGLGMDLPARLGLCTRRHIVLAWLHADRRTQWIGDRRCWVGQIAIGNAGANAPKFLAGASCRHLLQCAKPLSLSCRIHFYIHNLPLRLRPAAPARTPWPHTASPATDRRRFTDSPSHFLSLPLARYLPNAGESGRRAQTPRKFGKSNG